MTKPKARPAPGETIPLIPSLHAVLQALQHAGAPMGYVDLARVVNLTPGSLRERLHWLRKLGVIDYARVGKGIGRESVWFPANPPPPLRIVTAQEISQIKARRLIESRDRKLQSQGFPESMRAINDDSIDSWPVKRVVRETGKWHLDHPIGRTSVFDVRT